MVSLGFSEVAIFWRCFFVDSDVQSMALHVLSYREVLLSPPPQDHQTNTGLKHTCGVDRYYLHTRLIIKPSLVL